MNTYTDTTLVAKGISTILIDNLSIKYLLDVSYQFAIAIIIRHGRNHLYEPVDLALHVIDQTLGPIITYPWANDNLPLVADQAAVIYTACYKHMAFKIEQRLEQINIYLCTGRLCIVCDWLKT